MDQRIGWRWVVALAVAVLAGCSARAGTAVSAGSPTTTTAWRTVHFAAAQLDVPSSWPVHDLSKEPKLCVRFDVAAVYLGAQGPEPECPARLLGRTNAVQIQRLDPAVIGQLLPAATTLNAKGEERQDQPNSSTTRTIVAAFPKLGVLVTASFQQDAAVAQRIVDSVAAP